MTGDLIDALDEAWSYDPDEYVWYRIDGTACVGRIDRQVDRGPFGQTVTVFMAYRKHVGKRGWTWKQLEGEFSTFDEARRLADEKVPRRS